MPLLKLSSMKSFSVAKIAAFLVAASSTAIASQFAIPYTIGAFSSTVPRLWNSVRFFLVPPYLFITVHVIIVAIWKLSDQKLHTNRHGDSSDAVKTFDRNVTPPRAVSAEIPMESLTVEAISDPKPSVKTESNEISATSREVVEPKDLEGTWNAILMMKKSATRKESSEMAAVVSEVAAEQVVRKSVTFKDSSVASPMEGNDELDRKFEEFIRKQYDQIRSY